MKPKYIIIGISAIILIIGIIFLWRYIYVLIGGSVITAGFVAAMRKLASANSKADKTIKTEKDKINVINNVITDLKGNYESYKNTVDDLSDDASILNEAARLRKKRRK